MNPTTRDEKVMFAVSFVALGAILSTIYYAFTAPNPKDIAMVNAERVNSL